MRVMKASPSFNGYQPLADTSPNVSIHGHSGHESLASYIKNSTAGRSYGDFRTIPGRAHRYKKSRSIKWLVFNSTGEKAVHNLDKRQLIQHFSLEIPSRDMRLMDAALGYETLGSLLVRDNALVFSMDYVRMIITSDKVILPLEDEKNEAKSRFLQYLEMVITEHGLDGPLSPTPQHRLSGSSGPEMVPPGVTSPGMNSHHDPEEQPFELLVLETALGEVCNHLAREVDHLQMQTQPALEDLTKNANTTNLERVRRVKTVHQRLTGRARTVREALERLMEDDNDMWRMCLTRQVLIRTAPSPMPTSTSTNRFMDDPPGYSPSPMMVGSLNASVSRMGPMSRRLAAAKAATAQMADVSNEELVAEHDLYNVESLLESYFMLVDSTVQSLLSIGDYIDDTEDLINIQLDYSRNKLIKFEIVLTTGTFALAFYSVVAGVLGENLVLPDAITQDIWGFVMVNGGMVLFCCLTFLLVVYTLKRKSLI